VPLPFFPPGLRALADWLPFSGMMNAFTAAFAGKLTGPALALSLAQQLLWLVALTLLARLVMAGARRRVVVQGG
jgi:ABC-2 type transport system permease protein